MPTAFRAAWRPLALVAALAAVSASSQAANLFANAGFETGTLAGWSSTGAESCGHEGTPEDVVRWSGRRTCARTAAHLPIIRPPELGPPPAFVGVGRTPAVTNAPAKRASRRACPTPWPDRAR